MKTPANLGLQRDLGRRGYYPSRGGRWAASGALTKALLFIGISLLLGGCLAVWEREEYGAYPKNLGFNGRQYMIGWKQAFDLTVERMGK